jgi:hypothetical protein
MLSLIVALFTQFSVSASTPDAFTCKYESGFGAYSGQGSTLHEARSEATQKCFSEQVDLFEALRGRVPTDDEAEPILISCVNICG